MTRADPMLTDLEVAITGRLASMTRGEAVRRIAEAGGRFVSTPTRATALVVVGQGGPPLGLDGRPTHTLLRARELATQGAPIRIVPEEEFLALVGLGGRREDIHRLYTTAQLARILDVSAGAVRSWVRLGLVEPAKTVHRLAFFDFQQVAVARALGELERNGVSPARIRKSLEELKSAFGPESASIADLEVLETTDTLLVRLEDGRLVETCGQLRLAFDEADDVDGGDGERPRPISLLRAAPPVSAWFERALAAEEAGDLEEAVRAYRRALGEDGPTPEACFNLGNALYALDRKPEAADAYAQATEADPSHVEAWNNLGNVLSELERQDDAVRAYRRALAIEPAYADAHFNLAVTLAAQGDVALARRHYLDYLREDPNSPWADEVHDRLARLE